MNFRKKTNLFLIFAFIFVLAIPTLDSIFNFSPVKDLFENRLPVKSPEAPKTAEELRLYPKKFEAFFNDNFGTRRTLISLNTKMMDKIFNEVIDARVVVGKDGWYYFDNAGVLLDMLGRARMEDEMVDRGVEVFAKNWQEMKKKNISYLLVIAADKSTIYPEFLPNYLKPSADGTHRVDQFVGALKKKYPDFPVLDLRPLLKKAKESEIIYHQVDTHWNKVGAHYAYVAMMNELSKQNIKFKPHLRQDFVKKSDGYVDGDISRVMNLNVKNLNYDLVPKFKISHHGILSSEAEKKEFHNPVAFASDNQNLPVLFAYKDSYFGDLFSYVAEHFSKSYYANEHPCNLDYERIKDYHPNVVIQEFWEGRIEIVMRECK